MRKYAALGYLIFVFSCTRKQSVPDSILSPDKMGPVMWDIMRADELAEFYSYKDSSFKTIAKHDSLYQTIFNIHKTSRGTFKSSVAYYQNHPDLLKIIIDTIQRRLDSSRQKRDSISIKGKPLIKV